MAVLYGRGPRLRVSEQNSAARLLRELYRIGRARIPVRGMICGRGALDGRSIAALNCYLQHGYSGRPWRVRRLDGLHKWTWREIESRVGLRWVR